MNPSGFSLLVGHHVGKSSQLVLEMSHKAKHGVHVFSFSTREAEASISLGS